MPCVIIIHYYYMLHLRRAVAALVRCTAQSYFQGYFDLFLFHLLLLLLLRLGIPISLVATM